jgi:RNA polymerase sigma-70 factor, ECF subfamily
MDNDQASFMEPDRPVSDNQDEFLRLFSRYSRRIYEFILMLVMRHADADEVFQNTCLVLWKKFDQYESEGSFYSWACRIAYFEVQQMRRQSQRLRTLSEEALSLIADTALGSTDRLGQRQQALAECLQKLGDQDRDLIEQRYHYRRLPKEIAEMKSRSVHAIYRALARIHSALFRCVERQMAIEEGP